MRRQAIQLTNEGTVRPLIVGGGSPHGYKRAIFLVHGFNNDAQEAGRSYSTMRRGLDRVLRDGGCAQPRRRAIQELMWEFHWPGFYAFPSTNSSESGRSWGEKGITMAAYNLQVRKARRWVADAFAQYCLGLGAVELAFIAHSLGCRVTLEVIRRILDTPGRRASVSGALLMAGAVPVQFLSRGGRFHKAAATTRLRYCFYSRRDMVLMLAFPGGQALAGEVAPFAIGRSGWPRSAWNSHRNTRFGHSDYWLKAMTAPADAALNSVIAGMFLTSADSILPAYAPFAGAALEDDWLPAWRIAERRLQGADWLDDLCWNGK